MLEEHGIFGCVCGINQGVKKAKFQKTSCKLLKDKAWHIICFMTINANFAITVNCFHARYPHCPAQSGGDHCIGSRHRGSCGSWLSDCRKRVSCRHGPERIHSVPKRSRLGLGPQISKVAACHRKKPQLGRSRI